MLGRSMKWASLHGIASHLDSWMKYDFTLNFQWSPLKYNSLTECSVRRKHDIHCFNFDACCSHIRQDLQYHSDNVLQQAYGFQRKKCLCIFFESFMCAVFSSALNCHSKVFNRCDYNHQWFTSGQNTMRQMHNSFLMNFINDERS